MQISRGNDTAIKSAGYCASDELATLTPAIDTAIVSLSILTHVYLYNSTGLKPTLHYLDSLSAELSRENYIVILQIQTNDFQSSLLRQK